MEVTRTVAKSLVELSGLTRFQKLVLGSLMKMRKGRLIITLPNGQALSIGDTDEIQASIHIKNNDFFKRCALYGDVGFGESYVAGDWDTDSIANVIKFMILNIEDSEHLSGGKGKRFFINPMEFVNRFQHIMNRNSLKKSRENISFHYDLNNDFFQSFLDSTMTYSSALYTDKNMSLEEAQNAKYQNLCDNLELKESDEVLEIGCGWGGFSRYAASKYGCKFTCLTISKEQFDFAVAKNKEVGLDHLIEVKMQDYRLETKQFDKIASIEMMEAIGHEYLPTFYKKVSGLLKPEGIFSYQVITCPDSRYTQFRKGIDWIQKHIFPGSLLLAVGHMTKVFNEVSDMQLHKFIDFGPDYARTLNEWHKRFNDELPKIRTLGFDEPFIRKWNYYLKYCEAAFEMRNISVVQMTLVRPNNKTLK